MNKLILKNIRIGGNSIFEAKAYQEGQTPNYSAIFLMHPKDPQVNKIKNEIMELASNKWGKRMPKVLRTCLVPGDEKENEAYHGFWTISASERQQPEIINHDLSLITQKMNIIYPGCYVNAILTLWAQDNQYGKRINANLRAVQFVRDGEPIGREPIDASKEFEDLTEKDQIPFKQEDEEEVPLY